MTFTDSGIFDPTVERLREEFLLSLEYLIQVKLARSRVHSRMFVAILYIPCGITDLRQFAKTSAIFYIFFEVFVF